MDISPTLVRLITECALNHNGLSLPLPARATRGAVLAEATRNPVTVLAAGVLLAFLREELRNSGAPATTGPGAVAAAVR